MNRDRKEDQIVRTFEEGHHHFVRPLSKAPYGNAVERQSSALWESAEALTCGLNTFSWPSLQLGRADWRSDRLRSPLPAASVVEQVLEVLRVKPEHPDCTEQFINPMSTDSDGIARMLGFETIQDADEQFGFHLRHSQQP